MHSQSRCNVIAIKLIFISTDCALKTPDMGGTARRCDTTSTNEGGRGASPCADRRYDELQDLRVLLLVISEIYIFVTMHLY